MCGNVRYKHYESNEDGIEDSLETTTIAFTETTTDEILISTTNSEESQTENNPNMNTNGLASELEYQENCQSNQMDTNLVYGQYVPIAFITIISLAIIEAAGEGAENKKLNNVNEQQRKAAKIMQRTLVLILPTVFASFLLGTLAEYDQNLILYSIFTLVNSLLGGMIFFFHCTANEKMRKKIQNLRKKVFGSKPKKGLPKELEN